MRNWFKRNQTTIESTDNQKTNVIESLTNHSDASLFSRLKQGLSKTRRQLGQGIQNLLLGQKKLDAQLLEELETLLLAADFGVETTETLLTEVSEAVSRSQLADDDVVLSILKAHLVKLLTFPEPMEKTQTAKPFVILMVGVNGAGKTTTIGKLASQYNAQGLRVMLAAGDTFRTAAVEQLQAWGERNQIPIIAQHTGADSASVIFDAFSAACARGVDVLIADTAGRLHTQSHLMDELKKVKRVLQKLDATAPHEVMLVLDASIGQNALHQAREFHEAIGVTGIIMTKLDGTAKGGIVFSIAHTLGLPLRYIGVGEGIDDLRAFDAHQFVDAIFQNDPL